MATSTSLSIRGYGLTKQAFTPQELEAVRKELTVKPFVPKDYEALAGGPRYFKLFYESPSKVYIPKAYGLARFGPPAADLLSRSAELRPLAPGVAFLGSLRQEQEQPVQALLAACRDPLRRGGILNVFCGGGKTTMALFAAVQLGMRCMVVVHKDFLLQQWKERIQQFVPGARLGLIKAKTLDYEDADFVLASLQSLSMKDYDPAVFQGFGTVVIDEVHHASAEVFSQALKKLCFPHTIGLSATVQRKDGLSKVFKWFLGEVVFSATARPDPVQVQLLTFRDASPEYSEDHTIAGGKPNISRMVNSVCAFPARTQLVVASITELLGRQPDRKVLVLSDRRSHLLDMQRRLGEAGVDAGVYMGGMPQAVLHDCERKPVTLATYAIAAEGYDQQGLDALVLASPKSDVVQSVGRILRCKPADRRYTPLVIDVCDDFGYFRCVSRKRLAYYTKLGYEVAPHPLSLSMT